MPQPSTTPLRRRASVVACLFAGLAVAATTGAPLEASASAETPDVRVKKSLVIGTDGLTFARLQDAHTPNIDRLIAGGLLATSNLPAEPLSPTVSGPGWSTVATGVWADKHGVVDNSFSGSRFDAFPDYLTRLEHSAPDTSTVVVASWDPVAVDVFGPAVDERSGSPDDATTVETVVQRLATGDPDAVFAHLDEPDIAGHDHGAASEEYLAAIETVDEQVGELLAAVEARASALEEDWLVVLTTDHGHTPSGGHGGNSEGERGVFVAATGSAIIPGSVRHDVKLSDIAPTVLEHHGLAIDPTEELDGTPIDRLVPDDFDGLRDELQPAADEGAPADRIGWTHSPPAGWSIDNTRMPAGGVTEWRGWSFTTDEFWTNTDLGQGRETSVRNRDVFAVADSDEWDDAPHDAGAFDSTLNSPAFPVEGVGTGTLSFATNYQHDPTQSARVLASFDGGAPIELAAYSASANRVERLAVPVPAGATTVSFGFAHTGSNGSFWAVDQVRFEAEQSPGGGDGNTGGGNDGAADEAARLPATGAGGSDASLGAAAAAIIIGAAALAASRLRVSARPGQRRRP